MMRHFLVHYFFKKGLGDSKWELRTSEQVFDDIDPETTDAQLKQCAIMNVEQRFYDSEDYPLYGKFWRIESVEEINY